MVVVVVVGGGWILFAFDESFVQEARKEGRRQGGRIGYLLL